MIRPTPAAESPAPAPVRRRARAPRAPFVLLLVGLLCGGLVSLLLLKTVLAQDSFEATTLRNETNDILRKAERVRQDNVVREQPRNMANEAARLGERPAWGSPDFVDPDNPTALTGRSSEKAPPAPAGSATGAASGTAGGPGTGTSLGAGSGTGSGTGLGGVVDVGTAGSPARQDPAGTGGTAADVGVAGHGGPAGNIANAGTGSGAGGTEGERPGDRGQ